MAGRFADAAAVMRRALEVAAHGIGSVEPNPPVGAVLVDDQLNLVAEGYHKQFGGRHAEVDAIDRAGSRAAGATLFVTLEPCCHHGKTGPCTEAILRAGIRKVVVATPDPYSEVDGRGIAWLRSQGVEVEVGMLADEAHHLAAPFFKRVTTGLPWVHAKWALSLDGKIATRSGDSRWISNEASRAVVHRLRGRMDAIIVGAQTAAIDDPLLTARPAGPRVATRIVVDARAQLSIESQLVRTARDVPLLVAASASAATENVRRLEERGAEVVTFAGAVEDRNPDDKGRARRVDLNGLLTELGRREFTNVLVEGGSRLVGSFFDARMVDEVHVFVAPKIVGGGTAPSAVGGQGIASMDQALTLDRIAIENLDGDLYINGRLPPLP
jgi:diaminohydroxyphosphoribosylaminopyrimidine deaminase/5-amino-6-(5-phosphoribosylamino)uracil reductase